MKAKIISSVAILMSLLTVACSNGAEEQKKDHVFKGYENTLDKAKQIQPQMDEAEQKRRKQIEESMR